LLRVTEAGLPSGLHVFRAWLRWQNDNPGSRLLNLLQFLPLIGKLRAPILQTVYEVVFVSERKRKSCKAPEYQTASDGSFVFNNEAALLR
jgi:hypothetical protein